MMISHVYRAYSKSCKQWIHTSVQYAAKVINDDFTQYASNVLNEYFTQLALRMQHVLSTKCVAHIAHACYACNKSCLHKKCHTQRNMVTLSMLVVFSLLVWLFCIVRLVAVYGLINYTAYVLFSTFSNISQISKRVYAVMVNKPTNINNGSLLVDY